MSRCDQCSTDILAIRIADTDPTIMRALAVQVAFDRSTREVVHHPPAGVSSGACAKLRCVNAVQSHGRARYNDGVRISDLNLCDSWYGGHQGRNEKDVFQVLGP